MPIPCLVCGRNVPKPRDVRFTRRMCRRCFMKSPLPLRQEHDRNFKQWKAAGCPLTAKITADTVATWEQVVHIARVAHVTSKGPIQ